MSETEGGYQPEGESVEPTFELDAILISLEFAETEEMQHTHALLVDAIRAGNEEQRVQIYGEYCDQLEAYISSTSRLAEAQIAGDIAVAGIFKEGGNITRYIEELGNAVEYAENMGMIELSESLWSEINAYN